MNPVDVYFATPARQARNESARNAKPASGVNGSNQLGVPNGSGLPRIASTGKYATQPIEHDEDEKLRNHFS
jgi:hypothetical protein